MRYLVAVSGGIDSVVLLDVLVKNAKHELIVAHFDHGIREDSADDARFVEGLAGKYNLPFITKREELGKEVSEDKARQKRYAFLRGAAKKHNAMIATAHHQDDIIESIAINLIRGTGWRGLAVLGAADIKRPLRYLSKAQIREYARAHRLEWTEDNTNASSKYLRNRLRRKIKLQLTEAQKERVLAMWQQQIEVKNKVNTELSSYIQESGEYQRHPFIMVDEAVGIELLRAVVAAKSGQVPTRPQTSRALVAIKTARSRSTFEVGAGVFLGFTTNTFIVGQL
jgi:tRNA(Ile)-lysidine synthase